MELKMKYQYTNFVYPYVIDEKKYKKYILKLLKNKKCEIEFFEKEKNLNLYKYFLPNVRKYMFCNFVFTKSKIEKFKSMDLELQSTVLSKYSCVMFNYKLDDIQGKVDDDDGIFFNIDSIQLVCFNTGICFIVFKTGVENTDKFEDIINFNYKFREIYSKENDYEKIKIQTNSFGNMKNIEEIIDSIIQKNSYSEKMNLDTEKLYCYTYTCIDQEHWNEESGFDKIKNEFYKFSNVLPYNYNVRTDNIKAHDFSKIKFAKIGITKMSTAMLTSGIDTYNYTKLPYIYENEFFYTYLLELYKKIYLNKISYKYKKNKTLSTRKEFVEFTKNIWTQEITSDEDGNDLIKKWNKILDLDKIYLSLKNKYNLFYKEAKIEKNEKINKFILILLIISLALNVVNFIYLFR